MNKCDHPMILLVDDDEYNIFALKLLLLNIDLKADTANNGKTAVEMVKQKY